MSSGNKGRAVGGRGPGPGADLLQPAAVGEDRFYLVHTLVSVSGTKSRLLKIHRLLTSIATAARTVVKGTDSQRRFSAEFGQFCRIALVGLADLEDAVFERRNPGRRAVEAADAEVMGIGEMDFMKEVAGFLASQTQALTAQYLEHVATSAVSKHIKQQQQLEAAATAKAAAAVRKRESPEADAAGTARGSNRSPEGGRRGGGAAPALALGDGELGLMDEAELLARAALLNNSGTGGSRTTVPPLNAGHISREQQQPAPAPVRVLAEGVFLSSDGHTYDLRRQGQRLTAIDELQSRLEPWKTPQPFSTVELKRVTVDREKRTGGGGEALSAGSSGEYVPLLDVCLSATPEELLRRWESREAALAVTSSDPPPQQQGAKRSKRRAASPLEGHHPRSSGGGGGQSPPLKHSTSGGSPDLAPLQPEGGGGVGSATAADKAHHGEEGPAGPGGRRRDFFPSLEVKGNVSVPGSVMRGLVHFGVSSIDFLYD